MAINTKPMTVKAGEYASALPPEGGKPVFDWLGDIFSSAFDGLSESISTKLLDMVLGWFYEMIYNAISDFFIKMGSMGAEIFDLPWVSAVVKLFSQFGWALFAVGMVVAVFDVAIESQNGRASPKTTAMNILKGFLATGLFSIVPVALYKFCISLQSTFLNDLTSIMAGGRTLGLEEQSMTILEGSFRQTMDVELKLFNVLALIAFAYCVIKIFWLFPSRR